MREIKNSLLSLPIVIKEIKILKLSGMLITSHLLINLYFLVIMALIQDRQEVARGGKSYDVMNLPPRGHFLYGIIGQCTLRVITVFAYYL